MASPRAARRRSAGPAAAAGGSRWQRGSVLDALYLADSVDTMWAEWYRHLAERAVPPLHQLPRDVWRHRVQFEAANFSGAERLTRVGLDAPVPGRKGWAPFQRVGETRRDRGLALLFITHDDDDTAARRDPRTSALGIRSPRRGVRVRSQVHVRGVPVRRLASGRRALAGGWVRCLRAAELRGRVHMREPQAEQIHA